MPDSLPVHVSRDGLHSLEVPASFETSGDFDIRLINHGESLHVHLHLDDPLSEIAELDAGNHYVEGETERYVRVTVDPERIDGEEHLGKLKVASAYGAQTRWIDITVTEPEPTSETVEVDESLATPQPRETGTDGLDISPTLPILALGALAFLLAAVAAFIVGETLVFVGAAIVFAGVVGALFFLLRDEEPV